MTSGESELLNITTVEQILQLQGKQPGFLRNQIALLEQHWPQYMQTLELELENHHFIEAADVCHRVKGHVGMLGLRALHGLAEEMEDSLRAAQKDLKDIRPRGAQLNGLFQRSLKALEPWLTK